MQGTRVLFPAQEIKILHAVQWASLVTQTVKNLPEMQETQVQSQGQEDLLEKEVAVFQGGKISRLKYFSMFTAVYGWCHTIMAESRGSQKCSFTHLRNTQILI